MLFLQLNLGPDLYALEAQRVLEVIPMVSLKRLPGLPREVAGQFVYMGHIVPAIDLPLLVSGERAPDVLSTRIIMVARGEGAEPPYAGLIAERMTETVTIDRASFANVGLHVGGAPYLGGITTTRLGMIRLLLLDELLATALPRQAAE